MQCVSFHFILFICQGLLCRWMYKGGGERKYRREDSINIHVYTKRCTFCNRYKQLLSMSVLLYQLLLLLTLCVHGWPHVFLKRQHRPQILCISRVFVCPFLAWRRLSQQTSAEYKREVDRFVFHKYKRATNEWFSANLTDRCECKANVKCNWRLCQ